MDNKNTRAFETSHLKAALSKQLGKTSRRRRHFRFEDCDFGTRDEHIQSRSRPLGVLRRDTQRTSELQFPHKRKSDLISRTSGTWEVQEGIVFSQAEKKKETIHWKTFVSKTLEGVTMEREDESNHLIRSLESNSKSIPTGDVSDDSHDGLSKSHQEVFRIEDEFFSFDEDSKFSESLDRTGASDRDSSQGEETSEEEHYSLLSDSETSNVKGKGLEESSRQTDESGLNPSLHGLLQKYLGVDFMKRPGISQINSRWHTIIMGIGNTDDKVRQMEALEELVEILSMGTEETMIGLNLHQLVPPILSLLHQENDPEIMILACRCLANLIEALPTAALGLVNHGAVEILCSKLTFLEYIDLAEQMLTILEKLSYDHHSIIVKYGGLPLALQYVDFFSSGMQRVCVNLTANLCKNLDLIYMDDLKSLLPSIINLLRYDESKIVSKAIVALLNAVESFKSHEDTIQIIGNDDVLEILIPIFRSSKLQLSDYLYSNTIKLLKSMSQASLKIARELLSGDLPLAIKEALTGTEEMPIRRDDLKFGIHGSPIAASSYGSPPVFGKLRAGSTNQLSELLMLIDSLLPNLPPSFSPEFNKESEMYIGNNVIFSNETIEEVSKHPDVAESNYSPVDDEIMKKFGSYLLPALMDTYTSATSSKTRRSCLSATLKYVYYSSGDVLMETLRQLRISNFVAGLLASKRLEFMIFGVQIAEILIEKLPTIFLMCFRREGVVRELEILSSYAQLENSVVSDPTYNDELNIEFPTEIFEIKISSKKELESWNRITSSAVVLYQKHFRDDLERENQNGEVSTLDVLKSISESLKANLSEDEVFGVLQKLASYFRDRFDGVSVFELAEAGIVRSLIDFLMQKNRKLTSFQRILCFIRAFMFEDLHSSESSSQEQPMSRLISRLHDMLVKVEQLPIYIYEMRDNIDTTVASLKLLTQPLKLRLEKEINVDDLRDYSENVILVDPLVSLIKLEEFLLSRILHKSSESIETNFASPSDSGTSYSWQSMSRMMELVESDLIISENFESLNHDLDFDSVIEQSSVALDHGDDSKHKIEAPVQLDFSYNGKSLPPNILVFQAIYQNAIQSSGTEGSRFSWNSVYTLTYRKRTSQLSEEHSDSQTPPDVDHLAQELHLKTTKDINEFYAGVLVEKYGNSLTFHDEHGKHEDFRDILCLLRFLSVLAHQWSYLLTSNEGLDIIRLSTFSSGIFIDGRLSAKLQRQLQDLLAVCSGSIPHVWIEIAEQMPMVFPFNIRKNLLIASSFGFGRILTTLFADVLSSDSDHGNRPKIGRLRRQKIEIRRDQILTSAIAILNRYASTKSVLEIQYVDEVGIGLGPTQEFFTLVSHEFQLKARRLFHESHSGITSDTQFIYAPMGLYPRPINLEELDDPRSDSAVQVRMYYIIGQFLARALLDSRLITLQLNPSFWKLVFEGRKGLLFQDLEVVDPSIYRTLSRLRLLILEKRSIDCDASEKFQMNKSKEPIIYDGTTVEDLCLEFTLPGYPHIELKKGGSTMQVISSNLEEYIHLVAEHMLWTSVAPSIEAFKRGFNSALPLDHLRIFSIEELDLLLTGTLEPWNEKVLRESIKLEHGYIGDSNAINYLIEILVNFDPEQQAAFVSFLTGSPRLPVGGLKSLEPPFTVVRKITDDGVFNDMVLPSVMTCANYLKLPDYSSKTIMKEKLLLAIHESQNSFFLS